MCCVRPSGIGQINREPLNGFTTKREKLWENGVMPYRIHRNIGEIINYRHSMCAGVGCICVSCVINGKMVLLGQLGRINPKR